MSRRFVSLDRYQTSLARWGGVRPLRAPYLLRACLGPAQGYPRGYVTTLSQHPTLENALRWGSMTGSGNFGRLWVELAGAPAGPPNGAQKGSTLPLGHPGQELEAL